MRISLIVAMDKHGLIGDDTGLPWRLPADLKRFRKLTTGKPIILGRKTLQHIGGPLKDRLNIVLTRQAEFEHPGCVIVHSMGHAIKSAKAALPRMSADEIMIIGGADVYRQSLPFIERIYLTVVDGHFAGTVHFPAEVDDAFHGEIQHDECFGADDKNAHRHRFLILDRKSEGKTIREIIEHSSFDATKN